MMARSMQWMMSRHRLIYLTLACLIGEDWGSALPARERYTVLMLSKILLCADSSAFVLFRSAALAPCSDCAASSTTRSSKPRWDERLPVAFVFWYMPDSSDAQVECMREYLHVANC